MAIPTTSSIAISGGFCLFCPSFHPVLRRRRCAKLILSPSSAANAARPLDLLISRAHAGVYTRYLRSQGRLITEPQTPTEDLLHRYDQYLIDVRGLSASARVHHKLTLRALLTGFTCSRSLKKLSRDDVERFILERSRRISRHSLQHEVGQLRAFLRYAHDAGLVRERLDSLDTPRTYRDELPPRALPWPSVLKLLRSIDRASRNALIPRTEFCASRSLSFISRAGFPLPNRHT